MKENIRVEGLTAFKAEIDKVDFDEHKCIRIEDRIECVHRDILIYFESLYMKDIEQIKDLCDKHNVLFYIEKGKVLVF